MSSLAALTTLTYRIDSVTEQQHKILDNQKEILSLLKRVIGKPIHSVESIIRLRETGTNTPPAQTREQSTQSPINKDSYSFMPTNGQDVNDPIYARASNQPKAYSCPADK